MTTKTKIPASGKRKAVKARKMWVNRPLMKTAKHLFIARQQGTLEDDTAIYLIPADQVPAMVEAGAKAVSRITSGDVMYSDQDIARAVFASAGIKARKGAV